MLVCCLEVTASHRHTAWSVGTAPPLAAQTQGKALSQVHP